VGLSLVLVFIGVKMLIDPTIARTVLVQYDIPTSISLLVVAGIILTSIVASIAAAKGKKE